MNRNAVMLAVPAAALACAETVTETAAPIKV